MDAAVALFAEKGFEEASVRDITRRAGVNLAAINYHFGSRDALVQAVAERYFTPLCRELERRFDELAAERRGPEAEELVEAVILSMLKAVARDPQGISLFLALINYAYQGGQDDLRQFLLRRYASAFKRFLFHLRKAMPRLSDDEFIWRCHFLLGTLVLPLSCHEVVGQIEESFSQSRSNLSLTLHRLVPVLAAGLRAEADMVNRRGEELW
nr:TetR family transcriptional regulator [Motiliproteus sediminis]